MAKLRKMTEADIVRMYDEIAPHTGAGTDFFLQELDRRRSVHQNRVIIALSVVIAVLTLVLAIIAALDVWLRLTGR